MSNKKYRKFIAAAVVFVMIGMPFISYMYLRQGLTFRIDALSALKVDEKDLTLQKELTGKIDPLPGKVNAVVDVRDIHENRITDVYQKYQGNKYFHLITYGTIKELGEKHSQVYSNGMLDGVFSKNDMILIDTSGQVRESYTYSDEEFKKFVQQLTVLLPVEASKKIKLDR